MPDARITRSAVAGSSVSVTPNSRISHTDRSAVNAGSRSTTTGRPWNQAGTRMSMIPAIQAQSAGDHSTSWACG